MITSFTDARNKKLGDELAWLIRYLLLIPRKQEKEEAPNGSTVRRPKGDPGTPAVQDC